MPYSTWVLLASLVVHEMVAPFEVIEEVPTAEMTGGTVSGVEETVRLASLENPLSLPEVS